MTGPVDFLERTLEGGWEIIGLRAGQIAVIQPFDSAHLKDERKADEVFLCVTNTDEAFYIALTNYAAALDHAATSGTYLRRSQRASMGYSSRLIGGLL